MLRAGETDLYRWRGSRRSFQGCFPRPGGTTAGSDRWWTGCLYQSQSETFCWVKVQLQTTFYFEIEFEYFVLFCWTEWMIRERPTNCSLSSVTFFFLLHDDTDVKIFSSETNCENLLCHSGLHPRISHDPHQAGTSTEEGRLYSWLHPEHTHTHTIKMKVITIYFISDRKLFLIPHVFICSCVFGWTHS